MRWYMEGKIGTCKVSIVYALARDESAGTQRARIAGVDWYRPGRRRVTPRDHGLRPVLGQGRPDQRLDRQRGRQLQVFGGLDQRIGARPGVLLALHEAAV